jgi:rfaE bifunctional protein nucleotidyltransferase chain/domain
MRKKILNRYDLVKVLAERGDRSVVFTNGCFDILHAGHVSYLEDARGFGDLLVVAVNSDDSVRRLKGPTRPVNDECDRALVLAALESVSYVTFFDEDTPYELVRLLQPDVLVKGGDWTPERIVGADLVLARGGKALSLPYLPGRSTTAILEKIAKL